VARRSRLRVFGAAISAFLLGVGLVVALSVAGGAPRAAANPTGASPGVYVAANGNGGQIATYTLNGALHGAGPTSFVPAGSSVDCIGINASAQQVLVGFSVFSAAGVSPWNAEVVNVANPGTNPPSVALAGEPVGVAMDPVHANFAYVLESVTLPNQTTVARVDRIDMGGPIPTAQPIVTPTSSIGGSKVWPGGLLPRPRSIAISPNGSTLYVGVASDPRVSSGELAQIYSVPLGAGSIRVWSNNPGIVNRIAPGAIDLAVAPDGSQVFATLSGINGNATVGIVPVSPSGVLPTTGQHWLNATLLGAGPMTVSPGGGSVYVADNSAPGLLPLNPGNGTTQIGKPAFVPDGLPIQGMAISPDGATMIVVVSNNDGSSAVYPVDLSGPTFLPALASSDFGGSSSPQAVAITPDQAPKAAISAPSAVQVGQSITFDASASSVEFGAVNNFAWDFGDASGPGPNSQVVTHTYAAPGTYNVTLTETDSAGTSVPPAVAGTVFGVDGPGQTPYRRADFSARRTFTVSVTSTSTTTNSTTSTPTTTGTTNTTTGTNGSTTTTTVKGHKPPGTPTLVLNPAVGPPGTIVTVTGHGFKPNTPVTVSWTVSTGSVVIKADALGNLPAKSLLILTPDVLGPRFARASSSPPATAPFLVVPSTSEPGGDNAGLLFRSEGP
jgi:hypothetical protein